MVSTYSHTQCQNAEEYGLVSTWCELLEKYEMEVVSQKRCEKLRTVGSVHISQIFCYVLLSETLDLPCVSGHIDAYFVPLQLN